MSNDYSLDCPCCHKSLFSYNITHNLNHMAEKAGLYQVLWDPQGDKGGPKYLTAKDMIPILEKGPLEMTKNKEIYLPLNPENGWGNYDGLVEFVQALISACYQYPESHPYASR